VLVTIAAAIRTIRVSTAPCLQVSDHFVALCLPFSRPHAGERPVRPALGTRKRRCGRERKQIQNPTLSQIVNNSHFGKGFS
jgi:hypothetical protein